MLTKIDKVFSHLYMKSPQKVILGIDPGTVVMGYALLDAGTSKPKLILMDVLKMGGKTDAYERLELIHSTVCELIKRYTPNTFAIEAPFFGKNVQSMLKLGRAQGVAIAAAMQARLPVSEYSPKKIKQSITGNGNADKEQVWKMLKSILSLEERPAYFDATDALAVALCHHYQTTSVLDKPPAGVKGWAEFVRNNPGKVKAR